MEASARRGSCALSLLALLLAACVTQTAQTIREGIVGASRAEILECLGPPDDFSYPSERTSVWFFVRPMRTRGALPVEIVADTDGAPPHGRRGPTIVSGKATVRDTVEDRTNSPKRVPPGSCLIQLDLEDDRVTRLTARGATPDGTNADVECVLAARACVSL